MTNSRAGELPTLSQFRAACAQIRLDNGEPLNLQVWQALVIADFLTGVRETHLWVPEENGKTTLVAAINLLHLITTPSPRAVAAARNEKQAKVLYNQALAMVQATPGLDSRLVIRDGTNEIRLKGRKGDVGLKVIPADELSAHGAINTLVTIDEMHALPGLGLYRVLAGKLGKRPGAQFLGISTAGEPDSEFEQMRERILTQSPEIRTVGPRCTRAAGPQHIAWSYALEADDDIEDMAVVKLANPLESITPETLQAKRDLPGFEEKHWRTVVCNIPTRDFVSRFLPEQEWTDAGLPLEIPEGEPITLGIDWGWIEDATAFVPLWQRDDGRLILGPTRILEPPRDGTQLTPEAVEAALLAVNERNPIRAVAHDSSTMGGGHLMSGWLERHLPASVIFPVTPADVGDATGHFLEQLRAGALKHTRDATLTRHLLNAVRVPVGVGGDRFRLGRPKESRHAPHQRAVREIDAAVAAVLAVWGTVGVEPPPDPFVAVI